MNDFHDVVKRLFVNDFDDDFKTFEFRLFVFDFLFFVLNFDVNKSYVNFHQLFFLKNWTNSWYSSKIKK